MAEAVTTTENAATTAPPSETTTSTAPDWYESLSPEYKVDPHIMPFKGKPISEVLRSHIEAQKFVSSSIRLPKPDAKPEEREAFLADLSTKLGRPATAADYKKTVTLEALPDGTPWDESAYDEFLGEMHKAHATPAQVNAAANAYRRILSRGMASRASQEEQADKELRHEWGNDYDRNIALTNKLISDIGGKEVADILNQRVGYNPKVMRFLAAIAKPLEEQKIITPDMPGGPSPEDARAKYDAARADPNHPVNSKDPTIALKASQDLMQHIYNELGAAGRKQVATFG